MFRKIGSNTLSATEQCDMALLIIDMEARLSSCAAESVSRRLQGLIYVQSR